MHHWKAIIQPRLERVRGRVAAAADRSERLPQAVRIVAITKGQPREAIEAAQALGLEDIGENRVEEALRKQEELAHSGITWHMVGHIQSRKAGDIPVHFNWVHSIDRLKLARRLDRFAVEAGVQIPVLLECNVSGESSKEGWACFEEDDWPVAAKAFKEILTYPGLSVAGLMTMAPWVPDEAILRSCFRKLRVLRDYLSQELASALPELSMGMTDDFEIAIEEGATMIRLGRALFGERTR